MLKTDFLAYISPWWYQSHTCSSLFIKAITLLILFIIFLLGNSGASEPTPSSQSALLGSPFLLQLGQHPATLPSWETRPVPLLWKADENLSAAKIYPGINIVKIKTQRSLQFGTKQVHNGTREAICRGNFNDFATNNTQEAVMHHGSTAWQRGPVQSLGTKHNLLAIKKLFVPFY